MLHWYALETNNFYQHSTIEENQIIIFEWNHNKYIQMVQHDSIINWLRNGHTIVTHEYLTFKEESSACVTRGDQFTIKNISHTVSDQLHTILGSQKEASS